MNDKPLMDSAPLSTLAWRGAGGEAEALLALLQLNDSAFPTGGFTHSHGLEQLLRERRVAGVDEVEAFVRSLLAGASATADATAARQAALALPDDDLAAVLELDRRLWRMKAAAELRDASTQVGRRLIEEALAITGSPVVDSYASAVASGLAYGVQPVAFAVAATAFGVTPDEIAPALMFAAANGLLQAWMRLLPVSHRDVQGILWRLRWLIGSLTADLEAGDATTPLRAFHPLQEIGSMRHARAEARLFAS